MKILFISRAYPPVVGGIENQNYELSAWLPKTEGVEEMKTIANRLGKKFLPFFLFYATFRALFLMRKYDVLLLGDAVLSALGWIIKIFYPRKAVACVSHGLDLTYPLKLYQKLWVRFFVRKMDKLIAVGNETIREGISREIPAEKFVFIPNGVDAEKFLEPHSREDLEKIIGEKLGDKKILLTTGRLAAHKGVDWFCENVMPKFGDDVLYLIAGDGEKREDIKKIIAEKNLSRKIKMLGRVNDENLKILYNTTDVYVKPNIKVTGTMEGFGLVVIEAASCRLPVVAANLEGLKDAVQDGEDGFLVETRDTEGFFRKINELLADENYRKTFGEKARKYVVENFAWGKIARRYAEEIKKLVSTS